MGDVVSTAEKLESSKVGQAAEFVVNHTLFYVPNAVNQLTQQAETFATNHGYQNLATVLGDVQDTMGIAQGIAEDPFENPEALVQIGMKSMNILNRHPSLKTSLKRGYSTLTGGTVNQSHSDDYHQSTPRDHGMRQLDTGSKRRKGGFDNSTFWIPPQTQTSEWNQELKPFNKHQVNEIYHRWGATGENLVKENIFSTSIPTEMNRPHPISHLPFTFHDETSIIPPTARRNAMGAVISMIPNSIGSDLSHGDLHSSTFSGGSYFPNAAQQFIDESTAHDHVQHVF